MDRTVSYREPLVGRGAALVGIGRSGLPSTGWLTSVGSMNAGAPLLIWLPRSLSED